jgi:hypothetical protein
MTVLLEFIIADNPFSYWIAQSKVFMQRLYTAYVTPLCRLCNGSLRRRYKGVAYPLHRGFKARTNGNLSECYTGY